MAHWKRIFTLAFALAISAPALAATPAIDCPLRDVPYSIDSPLIDILLKPEAKTAIDAAVPKLLINFPPRFIGTEAPTFASIISLRIAAGFKQISQTTLAPLDKVLRAMPITAADRIARCARYDIGTPILAVPPAKTRILLFEKMTGFRDTPSVEAAHSMFVDMAARNGWALVSSDKGAAINTANLKQFDVVIWNNISGDVLTLTQRKAFKRYMAQGGGFVGIHGTAGDPIYFWDWYPDTLIGARFIGHPLSPQFQQATVHIESNANGIGKGLEAGWSMKDEWYSFAASPRLTGAHIIATLDESSYSPVGMGGQKLAMGDHPIAWEHCVGNGPIKKGRAFYSAIGHMPETYSDTHYLTMLEQAIGWAAGGDGKGSCGV